MLDPWLQYSNQIAPGLNNQSANLAKSMNELPTIAGEIGSNKGIRGEKGHVWMTGYDGMRFLLNISRCSIREAFRWILRKPRRCTVGIWQLLSKRWATFSNACLYPNPSAMSKTPRIRWCHLFAVILSRKGVQGRVKVAYRSENSMSVSQLSQVCFRAQAVRVPKMVKMVKFGQRVQVIQHWYAASIVDKLEVASCNRVQAKHSARWLDIRIADNVLTLGN